MWPMGLLPNLHLKQKENKTRKHIISFYTIVYYPCFSNMHLSKLPKSHCCVTNDLTKFLTVNFRLLSAPAKLEFVKNVEDIPNDNVQAN